LIANTVKLEFIRR